MMSPFVRRVVLIGFALLVLGAFATWGYRVFFARPGPDASPRIKLDTRSFNGITFEIEYEERDGANLFSAIHDDKIHLRRSGSEDFLECDAGSLFVNERGLPDVKPGDVVRWNLTGPLLINGVAAEPHRHQAVELDAAATPLRWTPRPSQSPRDTLSVAWAGAARLLVAAHGDGVIRIWDADTNHVVRTLVHELPNPPPRYLGQRAAVSPDGQTIASAIYRGPETTLWNFADGARKVSFAEPTGQLNAVQFMADNWLLETRGDKLLARNLADGRAQELGKVHAQMDPAIAVALKGSRIAWNDGAAIHGGELRFDNGKAKLVALVEKPIKPVRAEACLAFSPDGARLAVYNGASRLAIHDSRTFQPLQSLHWRGPLIGDSHPITALAFSPDGTTLAVGNPDSVRFYDVPSGRERGWLPSEPVRSLAYSADGRSLAAGLRHTPGLVIWDTADLVAK